ncbi:MAG: DUF3887 domain-containing protein [Myxococcota bacterium]|nr:DUF3887 domain-containing protein [Myxococcota bacterium]
MKKNRTVFPLFVLLFACAGSKPPSTSSNRELGDDDSTAANKGQVDPNSNESISIEKEAIRKRIIAEIVIAYNNKVPENFIKHFDERMTATLPADKLKSVFDELHLEFGKILSVDKIISDQDTQYVCQASCEKQPMQMSFSFDTQNRIDGLWFNKSYQRISFNGITKDATINNIAKHYLDATKGSALVVGMRNKGHNNVFKYGVIDKETKVSVNDMTLFEIGSITKTFTAAMLLAMEKKSASL